MRKALAKVICFYLLLTVLTVANFAQETKSLSEKSYRQARTILDAGVQALGGRENFRKVENISMKFLYLYYESGQSANPTAPYEAVKADGFRIVDSRNGRFYQEIKNQPDSPYAYWGRQIRKSGANFNLDLNSNVAYPLAASALTGNMRSIQRWFPHSLLEAVSERAGTLRYLGEETYDGKPQRVVSFADGGGLQTALYFDARTNLLTKFEIISPDPVRGDSVQEVVFSDYRDASGIKIPYKTTLRYGGEILSVQTGEEVKINSPLDDALFEVPKGMEQGRETWGALSVTTTKLANDVYFVNGMAGGDIWFYSQMFVAFKDYILVVEAPMNQGVSQAVITKIKETIPGKPIKYVVPTHYHIDHIGGIREYIAEGSTIVTTPGNQDFFESVAAAPQTIRPDRLALSPRKPTIETFTGKKIFSDGQRTVELYSFKSPHADEMVIIYLPQEKILFVTDLMMTRLQGRFPPATATEIAFAKTIKDLNLQVEKIANGHGWLGTMGDFLKELEQSDKKAK